MLTGLTLGSLLLGLALTVIVVLYLARPFAVVEDEETRIDREEVDALLLRKDALLRQIRELEDDMEAGKVAPELYQQRRPQLVRQAALIMQQLDAHGYVETLEETATLPAGVDEQIEAAVRRLRTPEQVDADIEAAVKQRRAQVVGTVVAANGGIRFCPQCGRRAEPDERFCPQCGYNLRQETPETRTAHA